MLEKTQKRPAKHVRLAKVKNGRQQLLEFVEAERAPLFYFLKARTNSFEDAQDLLQELHLRLDRVSVDTEVHHPRRYVYRMALNLVRDLSRRHGVRKRYSHDSSDLIALVDEAPDAERRLLDKERLRLVMESIDACNAKHRAAFLMHRFHDKSYADISTELGVSVSTVEKYIISVLKAIRHDLAKR